MIYKLSKTRERRTRDLTDIAYIKDSNGTILTHEDEIKARWKESFETLLNVENKIEGIELTYPEQGPIPSVNDTEIKPVETLLENKRLKWFGHCLRREPNHICATSLRLEISGRRNRGRPRKRWRDNIQGDMKKYQLTEDMAQDRQY